MKFTGLSFVGSVVVLSAFLGAMLLIALALLPYWGSLPPEHYRTGFQAMGPYLGSVMLPCLFLAIAFSGFSLLLGGEPRLARAIAFGSVLAIVPLYGIVHAPVNNLLLGGETLSVEQLISLRDKWALWHWVRTLLGATALVMAIQGILRWEK